MAGELWRDVLQVGLETVPGNPVLATRKVYVADPAFTRERPSRIHQFATGTRDNVRGVTLGSITAGGTVRLPVSAEEMIEWLLCGIQGGVTPTTPSGTTRLWTFKPGVTDLASMTIERTDGARTYRLAGVRVEQMTIAGNVREMNDVTCTLFATELSKLLALTTGLTDRTPTWMEGWETRLYIDAYGGTPGTTVIPGTMINWSVQIQNNLGRKYFADNTLAAGAVVSGVIAITSTITFEAAAAQTATEFDNWDLETYRMIRLEFGQNELIDVGTSEVQSLITTGVPTGGTFTLTFSGQTTAPIAYNATAAAVQTALEGLNNINTGDVVCTGGPLPGAITLTFANGLGNRNVAAITAVSTGLTGGTTPAAVPSTTTPGVNGTFRFVTIDIPGAWTAVDLGGNDAQTRTYQFSLQYVYDTVLAAGIQIRCQNARPTAF